MRIGEIAVWEAFLGVAKHGHFSKASEALRVPLPQVSKRIAKLENQLGVRLFHRTTRVVRLTDEGKALLPKIDSLLEDLREAESLFADHQELSGHVKVTCVPFIAHTLLLPALDRFLKLHPKIHIELELSESFVNIIEEGYDMAIRIETPKDSELVYRKLAPNDLIFCAAPEYLKKNRAKLTNPDDLINHDLLMLSIHRRCRFKNSNKKLGDYDSFKYLTCENGVFLTDLALKGMGVLVRSKLDVQAHLSEGRLVQFLKRHPLETFGHVHAVVPSKRYLAPRVRAFLDFVLNESKNW